MKKNVKFCQKLLFYNWQKKTKVELLSGFIAQKELSSGFIAQKVFVRMSASFDRLASAERGARASAATPKIGRKQVKVHTQ